MARSLPRSPAIEARRCTALRAPLGAEVPLSDLTSYDSLGELIARVNASPLAEGVPLDPRLVETRDAIAHGRVLMKRLDELPLRLLKFSRPARDNTTVRVTFNEELTFEWYKREKRRIIDAVERTGAVRLQADRTPYLTDGVVDMAKVIEAAREEATRKAAKARPDANTDAQ